MLESNTEQHLVHGLPSSDLLGQGKGIFGVVLCCQAPACQSGILWEFRGHVNTLQSLSCSSSPQAQRLPPSGSAVATGGSWHWGGGGNSVQVGGPCQNNIYISIIQVTWSAVCTHTHTHVNLSIKSCIIKKKILNVCKKLYVFPVSFSFHNE